MEVRFSFVGIILIIGVAQGFFLATVLFFIKKGNIKANRFLAMFLLFFSLLTIGDILYESHLLLTCPGFYLVFDPLLFILAPLCFFYVKTLTNIRWKFKPRQLFHFAPAILLYLLFLPIYFSDSPVKEKIVLEAYSETDTKASDNIFLIISAIQILIYLFFCLKLQQENAKNTKNFYSNQKTVDLSWLRTFLILIIILWIAFCFSIFVHIHELTDASNVLFTVTVYLTGYFGIKQPAIFFYEKIPEKNGNNTSVKKKYASSSLSDELANEYAVNLVDLVKNEKIYLNSELKLIDLAERMNLPLHHLSQLINENLKKNFNDFINDFRVEEFKLRLIDDKYSNLKIFAIGMDCGFNSKAAMHSIFKERTGKSPSEYRKLHTVGY